MSNLECGTKGHLMSICKVAKSLSLIMTPCPFPLEDRVQGVEQMTSLM